jgi:hypothetical protein
LNSHDQEFTLYHLLEFGNNVLLQKLRNLDLRLSLRRDRYDFEFDWGPGITEYGVKVFEDIDSKNQQEATTTQGNMRMPLCCDKILMEKKNLPIIIIPLC